LRVNGRGTVTELTSEGVKYCAWHRLGRGSLGQVLPREKRNEVDLQWCPWEKTLAAKM